MNRRPVRYSEKVERKRRRIRACLWIMLFMLLSAGIRTFIFQSWRITDASLSPALQPGDVVIGFPYFMMIGGNPLSISGSPREGDLVLVANSPSKTVPPFLRFADILIRFLSLQRISPLEMRYGLMTSAPYPARIQRNIDKYPREYEVQVNEKPLGARLKGIFPAGAVPASSLKAHLVLRIWPPARAGLLH